ncbi:MAG: sulfite exporter TauE/SafE family protein [Spirochaetales bacterium]|nr:sulfite exporter TauE/SafE family protein [Spirochaetales bacterium]
MTVRPEYVILGVIVLFANLAQALSGFGSLVIAVTLGALLFPIESLPPVLLPLNIVVTAWIVGRNYQTIDRRVLFRLVIPLMGPGVVLGLLSSDYLQSQTLRNVFAVMIVVLSILEIARLVRGSSRVDSVVARVPGSIWVFLSGIVHGLYGTGGPLLVYGIGREPLSAAAFRSTLSAIWLLWNSGLSIYFLIRGDIGPEQGFLMAGLLPVVLLGMWMGDHLHHRVSETNFRLIVFGLLLFAGGALLFR